MNQRSSGVLAAALIAAGGLATPIVAGAEPPADPYSIITLQDENASITTSRLPDRYYVNGLRLGYVSPTEALPSFASSLGRALFGDGRQRFSFDLEQYIFTPANTSVRQPPPGDRPYAGVLTGTLALIQDTDTSRTILGAQLGLVGPGAGAEELQNGFHGAISQGNTVGWNYYQIHNEPVGELMAERVWRVPAVRLGALETDVLPEVTVGLGNLRVYGLAGGVVRIGQGLASDFGVARVSPGLSGGDAYTPVRPFDWYVFAGADGQVVGHDITLNGNTAEASPSVSLNPVVAELEGGVAVMWRGVRITYTQVFQTHEFHGQQGGLHQFGSLAAAIRF